LNETIIANLSKELRSLTPPYGTHGFEHTERVYNTCRNIGLIEGADLDILLPAALLHDLARGEENHANISAEKAKSILGRFCQSEETIERVATAISTHSFSGNKVPKTLEAKILSDADKLDALGAIGIYRTAVYSGEYARSVDDFINHFNEKLLKLERLIFTNEAKRIARQRTQYMSDFLAHIEKELRQES
jgi:uncharacterized protein